MPLPAFADCEICNLNSSETVNSCDVRGEEGLTGGPGAPLAAYVTVF